MPFIRVYLNSQSTWTEWDTPCKVTPAKYRTVARAGLPARERTLQRVPEEGILKRSSAFLTSLAHHPSSKLVAERNSPDDESIKFLRPSDRYELRASSSSSRYSGLKGYLSILTNAPGDAAQVRVLRQSPSVQILSTKKKGVGVKKSVSFSSDTSFEEKRAPYRKTAVHEAKIYRKGVLQGELQRGVYYNLVSSNTHLDRKFNSVYIECIKSEFILANIIKFLIKIYSFSLLLLFLYLNS